MHKTCPPHHTDVRTHTTHTSAPGTCATTLTHACARDFGSVQEAGDVQGTASTGHTHAIVATPQLTITHRHSPGHLRKFVGMIVRLLGRRHRLWRRHFVVSRSSAVQLQPGDRCKMRAQGHAGSHVGNDTPAMVAITSETPGRSTALPHPNLRKGSAHQPSPTYCRIPANRRQRAVWFWKPRIRVGPVSPWRPSIVKSRSRVDLHNNNNG